MTPQEVFAKVCKESDLTERETYILRYRLGVDGEQYPLAAIGTQLSITKERVRQIEDAAKKRISPELAELLNASFPGSVVESSISGQARSNRPELRRVLKHWPIDKPIQYGKLHDELGLTMPEPIPEDAYTMGEDESMWTIFEHYGVTVFGKARFCTMCHCIKPIDQFLRFANGRLYQWCRACNSVRSAAYANSKKPKPSETPSA